MIIPRDVTSGNTEQDTSRLHKWLPANTATNLKCIGGNFVVRKERIHLRRNHSAVRVLNFNVRNVDMYSHDTCAIASQWVVEHNRPTWTKWATINEFKHSISVQWHLSNATCLFFSPLPRKFRSNHASEPLMINWQNTSYKPNTRLTRMVFQGSPCCFCCVVCRGNSTRDVHWAWKTFASTLLVHVIVTSTKTSLLVYVRWYLARTGDNTGSSGGYVPVNHLTLSNIVSTLKVYVTCKDTPDSNNFINKNVH